MHEHINFRTQLPSQRQRESPFKALTARKTKTHCGSYRETRKAAKKSSAPVNTNHVTCLQVHIKKGGVEPKGVQVLISALFSVTWDEVETKFPRFIFGLKTSVSTYTCDNGVYFLH